MLSDSEEITQKVIHQTTAYLIWLGRNCEKKKNYRKLSSHLRFIDNPNYSSYGFLSHGILLKPGDWL